MRLSALAAIALLGASVANAAEPGRCFGISYAEPTSEYGHGVLGENSEYKAIVIRRDKVSISGEPLGEWTFTYRLPEGRVFEDIEPHCADIDGEGFNEIVVVESDVTKGAQLAVYGAERDLNRRVVRMAKFAATPPIGKAYRWLAIAGIADFDGDGRLDIAYVETPHIGGVLRIWTLRDGGLVEIASAPGFSNHRIGQNFITGGVRDCGNGPELVLPNDDWSQTLLVRVGGGEIESAVLAGRTDRVTLSRALECR